MKYLTFNNLTDSFIQNDQELGGTMLRLYTYSRPLRVKGLLDAMDHLFVAAVDILHYLQ